jgi:hypothetical protein
MQNSYQRSTGQAKLITPDFDTKYTKMHKIKRSQQSNSMVTATLKIQMVTATLKIQNVTATLKMKIQIEIQTLKQNSNARVPRVHRA